MGKLGSTEGLVLPEGLSYPDINSAVSDACLETGMYSGAPIPLPGHSMSIEKKFPGGEELSNYLPCAGEVRLPTTFTDNEESCRDDEFVTNDWYSRRLNADIIIIARLDSIGENPLKSKFRYRAVVCPRRPEWLAAAYSLQSQLATMDAAAVYPLQAEEAALVCLSGMVSNQQMRTYVLTGGFVETSRRSLCRYLFRRCRPTVVFGQKNDFMPIAALCLHPIGYYNGSFAGALAPSDDVVAQLTLMRADEKRFWRQAHQHNLETDWEAVL